VVIEAIVTEFATIGLILNYNKTEVLLLENYPKVLIGEEDWVVTKIKIGEDEIIPEEVIKYLGVMVDDELCVRQHVEYLNK